MDQEENKKAKLSREEVSALAQELAAVLAPMVAKEIVRLQREAEENRLDAHYFASMSLEEGQRRSRELFQKHCRAQKERMRTDRVYRKQVLEYQAEQTRLADERRNQRVSEKIDRYGDDAPMTGNEVTAYLKSIGAQAEESPFAKSGNRPLYKKRDVDEWLKRKT